MAISHVIRGEEWLSSTPKVRQSSQLLLGIGYLRNLIVLAR